VRIIEPWQYGAILAVSATMFLAAAVAVGRRMGLIAGPPPADAGSPGSASGSLVRDGLAGILSLTAYLLILVAYSMAPLAAVAPLRESAIVLAAAWGSIRLGETTGRGEAAIRVAAAALVVAGALLLALGG
jgi:hypothetical protein